jgi:hypothetical protein
MTNRSVSEIDSHQEQENKIQSLFHIYQLRDDRSVNDFIRENPFLIELLFESNQKIKEHFGSDVQVILELLVDPEAGDYRELFALVLTELKPEEALERLEKLDNEWWLEASSLAKGLLNIDVEYI